MPGVDRRLLWSAPAENDLFDIRSYLALEASPKVADEQIRRIVARCEKLKDWPLSGPLRNEVRRDLRSLTIAPYVIFYRVSDQVIDRRVLHGHRDLDALISEPAGTR